MIFTQADIKAHITPERFQLGWKIFTSGDVSPPDIQRGGELITAVVQQNIGPPLRVYVRTSKDRNSIQINGECSCGPEKNCEHVVAVLLQALADQQASPDHSASVPLTPTPDRVESGKASRKNKSRRPSNQQALLYILHLDEDGLLIEPSVARCSPHGTYTITQPFEPHRAIGRAPARFLEPADLALLTALDQLPRTPFTNTPILDGPHSARILEGLIATGRCFLGNSLPEPTFLGFSVSDDYEKDTSLKLGPARPVEFLWLMDDFGYQRPAGRAVPEADILLPLSAPWYLDTQLHECGPVKSDLPLAIIDALIATQPIAPEQAQATFEALSKICPGAPIPAPQCFEIKTLPRVKPVPCLRLTTLDEPLSSDWIEYYDMACLEFDYDGATIGRYTPATRRVNEQLMRVQRDKRAEQTAVKQLRKLGFEEAQPEDDEGDSRDTNRDCFFLDPEPMRSEAEAWLDFQLTNAPILLTKGWRIEYDNFRYRLAEADNWICDVEKLAQQDWFNIGLGVEVEGQRVDLLPVLVDFIRRYPRGLPDQKANTVKHCVIPFKNDQGEERLLRLPTKQLLPLLNILLEIYGSGNQLDQQPLRLSRVQLARLTALEQADSGLRLKWLADDDIQQLTQRLQDIDGIPAVAAPLGLKTELRPYQQRGLNWLQFLRDYQLAGILADDMGLGKTVQTLAHLLLEKEMGRADRPSLVIAPTSLMFNWRHEAERFTPQLKVLVLHGAQRKQCFPDITDYDLVITTYPLLARDRDTLLAHRYHLLILDEAQVIKNPKAQASRIVRDIDARHRLCLTGTPLENHLGELWSLFDFLLPGLLGDSKQFRRIFRTPIENQGDEATAYRLSCRIRPFLLRRSKQQVAKELPAKTEIIQSVALKDKQRELYETVRLAMHRRVREEIERQGLARSHIVVLDALLKLRQVCCDPRLVKIGQAHNITQSAKLDMLMELLPNMIEEGRRILVFSQFTTMLGLIEDELKKTGIDYLKLTGQTRDRETPVRHFQDGKVPLFLISLKAGGVGLNLTAADTVIHYDPWWNPAVERQATDRAHRIGQQQAVFVYKLICEGTLEEKIHAMQQRKQALADSLYQNGGNQEPKWNADDLELLFAPLDAATGSGID